MNNYIVFATYCINILFLTEFNTDIFTNKIWQNKISAFLYNAVVFILYKYIYIILKTRREQILINKKRFLNAVVAQIIYIKTSLKNK